MKPLRVDIISYLSVNHFRSFLENQTVLANSTLEFRIFMQTDHMEPFFEKNNEKNGVMVLFLALR